MSFRQLWRVPHCVELPRVRGECDVCERLHHMRVTSSVGLARRRDGIGGARGLAQLTAVQHNECSEIFYSYYETPLLDAVSPNLGPVEGTTRVTINGTALGGAGSHLQCRFNRSFITPAVYDATYDHMSCSTAVLGIGSLAGGSVPLEVSLNAQQFGPSSVSYQYYSTPHVSAVLPFAGPADGGILVEVQGHGLGGGIGATPDYFCRFNTVVVPASLVVNADHYTLGCIATTRRISYCG